jgi:hypothetical protein
VASACDREEAAREVSAIRHLLADQKRRARWWNVGWGAGYGAATAGQLVFAIEPDWAPIDVDADMRKGLFVGAGKSAIGSASRIVLPLKTAEVPDGDPCEVLEAARDALRWTGRKQRNSFWLNHLGGLAVNLGGALILGLGYGAWETALTSFAVGYPVGLISTYTQPRGAWRGWRRLRRGGSFVERLSVAPIATPRYRGVAIGFSF